jgi:hypothetical protein
MSGAPRRRLWLRQPQQIIGLLAAAPNHIHIG